MPRYDKYGPTDDRTLEDLDRGFVGFNNRLRPDQLSPGLLAESENARLDRDGSWTLRNGVQIKKAPLTSGTDALILPFTLAADDTDAAIADPDSNSGNLVITNITGSLYANSGTINLSNVSGITPDPNANQAYTKTATNTLTVTGSFTGAADASVTVKYPMLNDTAINKIYGACNFSDPNSNNNENYIILAANTKGVAIKTSDPTATPVEIPYDGVSISDVDDISMMQAFNKVFIFRKGKTALEIDFSTVDITSIGSNKFTLVDNGDFAVNTTKTSTVFDAVAGKVVVGLENHGYSIGDFIRCTTVGDSGLTLNERQTVAEITSATPDTFTFFNDTVADVADAAVSTYPKFSREVSEGLGYIHMPCPEFATLHNKRLIMPYQFDQTGSSGSPTITSRKIFDEVIASDFLDANTYDRQFAALRFNAGTSDFTVGITSFTEDSVLIFNKNSIYRVVGTTNITGAAVQILTDEIGATARDTITQIGKNVFFLSDNGVYSLEFLDQYNLRGTQVPLSEPIQGTIDRINQTLAPLSKAVYFDNRYYLAVPLDSTRGANDATNNNTIIVYNFLNNQWESIDSIDSQNPFSYTNLIVSGSGITRGVYVVNEQGGVHLLAGSNANFSTEAKSGKDITITTIGGSESITTIPGKLKTRMYTYGDIGRKKFNGFDIQAEGNENVPTDFSIKIQTENIDLELTDSGSDLGRASTFLGSTIAAATPPEDVAIRGRIGNKRAYGAQLQIQNIEGTPSIRTIKTSATQTFRSDNPAT
tara:strand:- start:1064 stop:3352 length:2289 start_codon:yes stop_codon:yes gene_type:complete